MAILTAEAVAGHAYAAGFRGEPLAVAVAIAHGESGFDTAVVGDQRLAGQPTADGRTWGPSIGLWQIRSIVEESFTGRSRDATRLTDPGFNARSAYEISGGGTNFNPWSVFKEGIHRQYLDEARAAAAAVEARGGTPSGSSGGYTGPSSPVGPTPDAALGTSTDVAPTASPFDEAYIPPTTITGFTIQGRPLDDIPIRALAIAGSVSLSVNQVSEITLAFADPAGDLPVWDAFLVEAEAAWNDIPLQLADLSWDEQGGVEVLTAIFRSRGAQRMRRVDLGGGLPGVGLSRTWTNMSPTEVMAERAAAVGLTFYGKGTARRPDITRHGREDAGQQAAESDWDLGQRLAREEGFWCFEAAGALYFAPPSWLAERTTRFPVRWRPDFREKQYETLGMPKANVSIDTDRVAGVAVRQIIAPLPRWRGELVRPGMTADFGGIPGFGGGNLASYGIDAALTTRPYLVTDVNFDLDGGLTPATIELSEPVDPVPDPPDPGPIGGFNDDQTTATGTATAPVGPSGAIGPGGPITTSTNGPFGYQFDPAGTACTGREQPGMRLLFNHLLQIFPGTTSLGIYNCRPVRGGESLSLHGEGRAGDVGIPAHRRPALGDAVAAYLVRNAALLGVQQIIWNRRDWNSRTRTWTPYGGSVPHIDHVHVELCWAAARGLNASHIAATGGTAS